MDFRASFGYSCLASYRDIPAEKLGDVLRVISAYKIAKDAPADTLTQHVTRALDEMYENASVLEAWLTLQAAR